MLTRRMDFKLLSTLIILIIIYVYGLYIEPMKNESIVVVVVVHSMEKTKGRSR